MSFFPRVVTAAGLIMGLGACSDHSIEGRWTCNEETREFDAAGRYLFQADGGFDRGIYRIEGDLLITTPNRVRSRISSADRALTLQMLSLTGNRQGLTELLTTGFVTTEITSVGEYGARIDVLSADRLETLGEFFPGRNGERINMKQPRRTSCERTPSPPES